MSIIRNHSQLTTEINRRIEIAVENSCNRLLGTLQEIIDKSYYDQFEPDFYNRTYRFWKSATVKMLSMNCGQIFMDKFLWIN